jgi:NADPH:quinone reductase-like Zn-dependent oxidoreductase
MNGIKTIAVASSDDKLAVCTKFGATATVNYKTNPDWEKEVLALT